MKGGLRRCFLGLADIWLISRIFAGCEHCSRQKIVLES
jgi:hypothetical protein